MQRSTDRILTTHVGSLIRPEGVQANLRKRGAGEIVDEAEEAETLRASVIDVIARQKAAGIDIPSDGEFGKPLGWSMYALERLSGFERRPVAEGSPNPFNRGADRVRFADFYREREREPESGERA